MANKSLQYVKAVVRERQVPRVKDLSGARHVHGSSAPLLPWELQQGHHLFL